MHSELDADDIELGKLLHSSSTSGRVQTAHTGEERFNANLSSPVAVGDASSSSTTGSLSPDDSAAVDSLFNSTPAYVAIKKERPQHRLILWLTLQGHKPKEISATVRCTVQTVYNVQNQPWFQEAFCKLAAETGKDAVKTFLEGQVLPALQRTVALATSAESEAVRLAANKEVLDRFLGKPTVHVDSKSENKTTLTVQDGAAIQDEMRRLDEQLKARGISIGGN